MVLINSFEGENVTSLFDRAIGVVDWSFGLSKDVKRVAVLYYLYEGICTRRFICTEMYKLSRNQEKLNALGFELENNRTLHEQEGFFRSIFNKFLNSQIVSAGRLMPPPTPPRLRRSFKLELVLENDGNYALYRSGKRGGYNVTTLVTDFSQLECDL